MYFSDQESLKAALIVIELFSKCSGLRINRDKSEAIWIGASSNFRHKPCGLSWPEKTVKCLGVHLCNDILEIQDINFKEKFNKIEGIMNQWCVRNLTLKGKILIANTLILSQLLYICSVVDTPKWVFTKYKELILQFIWNNKPAKVKYTSLINNIDNGGMCLQDLESKVKSLKIK